MSDVGVKITSEMWALGTNLDTTQLPSLEMEELSNLLRMLYILTLVAGKDFSDVAILA